MLTRCENPEYLHYQDYGGRGIGICDEWHTFQMFYDWAIEAGAKPGLEIDRIDNDGNYEPDNCHWVPRTINARNKRDTRWVTAWGERKAASAWLEDPRCKVRWRTLYRRLDDGWSPEAAMTAVAEGSELCVRGHLRTEFPCPECRLEDARLSYARHRYAINQRRRERRQLAKTIGM
jgi:hypothetical protein